VVNKVRRWSDTSVRLLSGLKGNATFSLTLFT
jgi:hypothetical protein